MKKKKKNQTFGCSACRCVDHDFIDKQNRA